MPILTETIKEMHTIGYRFEMRSDENYGVGEEFVWADLTLRVTDKNMDDYRLARRLRHHWPWRFTYEFEVVDTKETLGKRRGTI